MIRNLCDFVGHAIVRPVETRESAPTTTPLAIMVVPVKTLPGFSDFSYSRGLCIVVIVAYDKSHFALIVLEVFVVS
jgi:hypothetical protein